jgi:hypothetical protein
MPAVAKDVEFILSLFFKCEKYRALPYPGGVLSQPAWIMSLFATIDERRNAIQEEKAQLEAAKNSLK